MIILSRRKKHLFKKIISRIITIVALTVFVYAGYGLFDIVMDYYKNRKTLNDLQVTFYDSANAEDNNLSDQENLIGVSNNDDDSDTYKEYVDDTQTTPTIQPKFDDLLKQNEDVVGWITVDGTQIDYPILQAEDNVKYLNRNFYHEESRAGSIFLDYRNDIQLDDERNIVVYGHRMKDGSMFQHITKFLDEDFFKEHRTIEFDTLYEHYEAEIFAVYNTLTTFDYIQTYFEDEHDYENLLTEIKNYSKFDAGVEVTADDKIITLSTCDYVLDQDQGRLVLHAKLIEK